MLSQFKNNFAKVTKAKVLNIEGFDWFCTNKNGQGVILSTDNKGCAPTPPDSLMMSLGACAADSLKFLLEKHGKMVKNIITNIEADWEISPKRRISEFRLNFLVDTDDTSQELLDQLTSQVETKMCTVAQTLQCAPVVKRID
ncbi:OsmC family protein [Histomonas meleagridis]|uniref:OsmC family protein n=1 Tax=Histomonas meleagridis TaxID=135588 RepID=UPI00355AAAC6|nr:OsmC family protein [Histomonas meleagridis]KAH0805169.1 OsmC family protein [Histomonas meleagridis]